MREPATLTRRALAAALPLAALTAAPATALPALATGDDTALLELGRRWSVALAALHAHDLSAASLTDGDTTAHRAYDALSQRLFDDEQELFDRVMALPARTVQGLGLKGQALARAFDVTEPGITAVEAALVREAPDLEHSAALTLALDILRLARSSA